MGNNEDGLEFQRWDKSASPEEIATYWEEKYRHAFSSGKCAGKIEATTETCQYLISFIKTVESQLTLNCSNSLKEETYYRDNSKKKIGS
jgi:hypothetical protein